MLSELHIKNFSIIEDVQIKFQPGFQALSGETGAGKSFLVSALQFVLGARADGSLLRSGAEEAQVVAVLDGVPEDLLNELQAELGIAVDGVSEGLILKRLLSASLRSRAFLNDHPVSLKTLQKIGKRMIRHVGQFAAQELFSESFWLDALDRFGRLQPFRRNYHQALTRYQECARQLAELTGRLETSKQREDFLRFQLQELKSAKLKGGEEEDLEAQKQRLKHRVALVSHARQIAQNLSEGEEPLTERLAKACQGAQKASGLDASLVSLHQILREASERVETAAALLREYGGELEGPAENFDRVEGRLEKLHQLKTKYRMQIPQLITLSRQLEKDLAQLEDAEIYLEDSKNALAAAEKKLLQTAKALGQKRRAVSEDLGGRLKENLRTLSLPHVQLHWEFIPFESLAEYKNYGGETVELKISFNPGENPKPFREIISGGELSRLFLALFEIRSPVEGALTFILDEVDSGVGGAVAEQIGNKLSRFGRVAQVLCITHLPQIASRASSQFVVKKNVRKGRTYSEIRLLNPEERVQEIARMLAGVKVTERALQHARELLSRTAA